MPSSIETERRQIKRLVTQAMGRDYRQPTNTMGQIRADGLQEDINALPLDDENWQPLQVFDLTSANFGRFRFMVGLSSLNGNDVIE